MAGAVITKNYQTSPDGFEEKYSSDDKSLTPWMQSTHDMEKIAFEKMPDLCADLGKTVEVWLMGVHPDYRGNKIANSLMREIVPICKKAGCKYVTMQAGSYYTAKAATTNNFFEVFSFQAKDWLWKGEPLYAQTKAPHEKWSFFAKLL